MPVNARLDGSGTVFEAKFRSSKTCCPLPIPSVLKLRNTWSLVNVTRLKSKPGTVDDGSIVTPVISGLFVRSVKPKPANGNEEKPIARSGGTYN